jgi:hypothetical protein
MKTKMTTKHLAKLLGLEYNDARGLLRSLMVLRCGVTEAGMTENVEVGVGKSSKIYEIDTSMVGRLLGEKLSHMREGQGC